MLIKNIALNTAAQGYLFLLSFFTTPLLLTRLGEEKYGIWGLTIALVNQFSIFDLGLNLALAQKIATFKNSPSRLKPYLKTALISYLFFAILGGTTLFLLSPFLAKKVFHLSPSVISLFRITACNISLYFLTIYTDAFFQGWERFDLYNLKTIIVGTSNTLGAALLLLLGFDLPQILLLYTISLLFTLMVAAFIIVGILKINPLEGTFSSATLRKMINLGIFKFSGNLAEQVNFHFPKFVIAHSVGINQLPLFTLPLALVQKTGIFLSQIYLATLPRIARLAKKRKRRKIATIFWQGELFVLLTMLPFLLGGVCLGKKFLAWWLKNPSFAARSAPLLSLLTVAYFLRAFSTIPVAIVEGLGNTRLPSFFVIGKMLATLALAPWIISKEGVTGAGWLILGLTSFTLPLFLVVSLRFLRQHFNHRS